MKPLRCWALRLTRMDGTVVEEILVNQTTERKAVKAAREACLLSAYSAARAGILSDDGRFITIASFRASGDRAQRVA